MVKKSAPFFFFFVLALVIRWPTVPYIDSAPLDPNFPLHALAAKGLSEGHFLSLPYLEWPDGARMRYIAIPLLLIAAPINWLMSPIPAMNIAVLIWVFLQGCGGYVIGRRFSFPNSASLFLGTGCMVAPIQILALGNGQFENVALFPLLWLIWALRERRSLFFPFFILLFSSPYQGIVGLFAVMVFYTLHKRHVNLLECGLVLLLGAGYYAAVATGDVHASVEPAPAVLSEKAQLWGLFLPSNIAESGTPLPGWIDRIRSLLSAPSGSIYNHRWPWVMSTASSYVGWGLFLGLAFCYRHLKKKPRILLWGLICLIAALGSTWGASGIPLPWGLSAWIPGIHKMQATARLLSGVSAAILLYVAACRIKPRFYYILTAVLVLDGLLVSPAHWPLPAKAPLASPTLQTVDEPVAFWPAAPVIASQKVTMTSLMLEQPLSLFAETNVQMPNPQGKIERTNTIRKNQDGQTPSEWKADICRSGIKKLIQFRDIVGNESQPFVYGFESCDSHFCMWSLCTDQGTP
ncbi:MAG: hypothetical protein VX278_12030 [Myxococcota bacterium]|nr:hypothetical protein [Myxococcota bacterium]